MAKSLSLWIGQMEPHLPDTSRVAMVGCRQMAAVLQGATSPFPGSLSVTEGVIQILALKGTLPYFSEHIKSF